MSCHPRVTEWTTTIQTHLPHLTKPQATVLALWSLGIVLARSCALTAVSAFLATGLHRVRGGPLKTLVPELGTSWQGTGIACKGRNRPRHCPLLASHLYPHFCAFTPKMKAL